MLCLGRKYSFSGKTQLNRPLRSVNIETKKYFGLGVIQQLSGQNFAWESQLLTIFGIENYLWIKRNKIRVIWQIFSWKPQNSWIVRERSFITSLAKSMTWQILIAAAKVIQKRLINLPRSNIFTFDHHYLFDFFFIE